MVSIVEGRLLAIIVLDVSCTIVVAILPTASATTPHQPPSTGLNLDRRSKSNLLILIVGLQDCWGWVQTEPAALRCSLS